MSNPKINGINVGGVEYDIDVDIDIDADSSDISYGSSTVKDALDTHDEKIEGIDKEIDKIKSELNSRIRSHVGMVIMTTSLDTMAKVIEVYGGTSWTKIESRFLIGASSSYPVKSTGGSASENIPSTLSEASGYAFVQGTAFTNRGLVGGTGGRSISHIPPYKAVYIWERTA